jgi:hypothetical protein
MILPRYLLALQSVDQFVFDPRRAHGLGRQDQQEPITTLQSGADLVVPLLGSANICLAYKTPDPVVGEGTSQTRYEGGVPA